MSARRDQLHLALADGAKWLGGRAAQGLRAVGGDRSRGALGILVYHRVTPEQAGHRPTLNVDPSRFRAQLDGLLRRGHHFISLSDALAAHLRGEPPAERTVVVTFDDGYAGVHEHALPVLEELGVPATVFITTDFIGSADPFPFDRWGQAHRSGEDSAWRPLSWAECEALAGSGLVEIGSHTATHGDFRGRPAELAQDVERSLAEISGRLGPGPRPFAFPFGSVDAGFASSDLAAAAARAGVTCGLTTEIRLVRPDDDPFAWGRLEASRSDTAAMLSGKLAGWYEWMGPARRLFQRIL